MSRKILTLILAIVLLFAASCGGQKKQIAESQAKETIAESLLETTAVITTFEPTQLETEISIKPDLRPEDYRNYKENEISFDIPKLWLRTESDGNIYFYEETIGKTPFIIYNATVAGVEADFDSVPWAEYLSGVNVVEYRVVSNGLHKFVQYDYEQKIEGDSYQAYNFSTYENNTVYTVTLLIEEVISANSYYDLIIDNVKDTIIIDKVRPDSYSANNDLLTIFENYVKAIQGDYKKEYADSIKGFETENGFFAEEKLDNEEHSIWFEYSDYIQIEDLYAMPTGFVNDGNKSSGSFSLLFDLDANPNYDYFELEEQVTLLAKSTWDYWGNDEWPDKTLLFHDSDSDTNIYLGEMLSLQDSYILLQFSIFLELE